MTVKISKNLDRRLRLLRESRNFIEVIVSNRKPVSKRLLEDYQQDLKICKELLKKELIKAPINNIL